MVSVFLEKFCRTHIQKIQHTIHTVIYTAGTLRIMVEADCLSLKVTNPEIASNSETAAGVIFQYTCTSPNTPGPRTRLGGMHINR